MKMVKLGSKTYILLITVKMPEQWCILTAYDLSVYIKIKSS